MPQTDPSLTPEKRAFEEAALECRIIAERWDWEVNPGDEAVEDFREVLRRVEQAAALRAREEILADLDKYWSFTEEQQHTHSWHDKQDFLKKWKR